ncbi:MAG: membrane protein insertion efficiency factor YidD [Clostridia bacterium]|nr:membrane protein insertion efficiency factor YidD [Clostridia bacterium]
MKRICVFLIKLYRKFISPHKPSCCRFRPTCSEYALSAYVKYGFFKATYLVVKRILKCHPFHEGGYDPLP